MRPFTDKPFILLNDSFRFCPQLKARVSPLEKEGEPIRAIHLPYHHYCALIEPLYVGGSHCDQFLLLIPHPFRLLNSLLG